MLRFKKLKAKKKIRVLTAILILFFGNKAYSQLTVMEDVTYSTNRCFVNIWIKGRIFDIDSQESLSNVTIGIRGTKLFCVSDSSGQYALNILPIIDTLKTVDLIGYFINYQPFVIAIKENITKDTIIDMALKSNTNNGCPEVVLPKKGVKKIKKIR